MQVKPLPAGLSAGGKLPYPHSLQSKGQARLATACHELQGALAPILKDQLEFEVRIHCVL
jgi:hypothetical protein